MIIETSGDIPAVSSLGGNGSSVDRFITGRCKSLSIFAVDPGETTGWFWIVFGRKELARLGPVGVIQHCVTAPLIRSGPDADVGAYYNVYRAMGGQVYNGPGIKGEIFGTKQLISLMALYSMIAERESLGSASSLQILVEDFILREQSQERDLLSPVRLTAALHYGLSFSGPDCELLEMQTPSEGKANLPRERLVRYGLWKPGDDHKHEMDALRHTITFMRKLYDQVKR